MTHSFAGILFDFDGTIIDSTEAITKNWQRIGADLGIDPQTILQTSHGRRSIDVLTDLDPSKANWTYVSDMERRIPYLVDTPPIEIPGARALLEKLGSLQTHYAIVTSGTKALLESWLDVLDLPRPHDVTVAEDVEVGKPHPEGYANAKARLLGSVSGGGCRDVLVVEDAPAGVRAGKAAGCFVLAVRTTHGVEELKQAGADWVVPDLRAVEVAKGDGGVVVQLTNVLK
ncbi:putative 2-deoxyglucose-6-phosphate phosphatase [Aspergillus avenaceus]|uniref:Putative 2-deoxyglucose-6-phosphate phosphatase n=1 Tax=Aspergillus avenaceus TaxID=36643 RepID=A0A5N6TWY4_ASPAV|nr:putative 2-deoxyglucose-6-phosphate phosphatase [Aspergillus avenaceus]